MTFSPSPSHTLHHFSLRRNTRISSAHTHDLSVFLSISMLARAVGSKVEKEIRDMLEPMFSAGLSPELTSALRIVSQEIPGLQREIQGQWFDLM